MRNSAIALSFAIGMATAPAAAVTLTYATWQPEASSDLHATSLHWFSEELARRTQGQHTIRMMWGGTLAGISEIPDTVESRAADMGDLVVPYFPDQFPVNNAIGFHWPQPHSPLELAEMMAEFHETYEQFGEELLRFNLKLIGLRPLGYYGMLCTEPVRSMAEFRGKRIRAYGVSLPAAIQAIGGVPVSMTTVETYEALERGVLDCTPIEPVIAAGQQYDDVARYYIDVPLGASWGQFIIINNDVYQGLPEDLRETLDTLGKEYHTYFTTEQDRLTQETLDRWTSSGRVEVIALPPEEFLAATENNDGVRTIRRQWVERAQALGLPADDIAARLAFPE